MTIQACLGGPFEIPQDCDPISPVYLFGPPYAFQSPVRLDIDVFADLKEDDKVIFLTSEDKPSIAKKKQVWNFKQEAEDVSAKVHPFSDGRRVISVSVRHFCFGLLARFRCRRRSKLMYFLMVWLANDFCFRAREDVYRWFLLS